MPTQKEILEQDLAEELAEAGPDSPLVKHLKAQIASFGTIRWPSELAVLKSSESDKYHAATLRKKDSAPPGDMSDPKVAASIQDVEEKTIARRGDSTSPGGATPPDKRSVKPPSK